MLHGFWDDLPVLRSGLADVKNLLLSELAKGHPTVKEALSGVGAADGKMLRAGYFMLCAGFGELPKQKRDKFGAAIELLHLATLIHDDVIDDSASRRGRPTIHTRYGKRNAVLMGDYLLTLCFTLVAEYARPEAINLLARTLKAMCTSELQQAAQLFCNSTSVRQYLRRITGKTAALFSLSCYLGGYESRCPPALTQQLAGLGHNIGMAFQIIDDILDFRGEEDRLGKPVYKDLTEGVFTLPLILAMQKVNGQLGSLLGKVPYTEDTTSRIIELVKTYGLTDARAIAEKYTARALKIIDKLPPGPNRQMLADTTTRLLNRNS